jgi:hypothetical protein
MEIVLPCSTVPRLPTLIIKVEITTNRDRGGAQRPVGPGSVCSMGDLRRPAFKIAHQGLRGESISGGYPFLRREPRTVSTVVSNTARLPA